MLILARNVKLKGYKVVSYFGSFRRLVDLGTNSSRRMIREVRRRNRIFNRARANRKQCNVRQCSLCTTRVLKIILPSRDYVHYNYTIKL